MRVSFHNSFQCSQPTHIAIKAPVDHDDVGGSALCLKCLGSLDALPSGGDAQQVLVFWNIQLLEQLHYVAAPFDQCAYTLQAHQSLVP